MATLTKRYAAMLVALSSLHCSGKSKNAANETPSGGGAGGTQVHSGGADAQAGGGGSFHPNGGAPASGAVTSSGGTIELGGQGDDGGADGSAGGRSGANENGDIVQLDAEMATGVWPCDLESAGIYIYAATSTTCTFLAVRPVESQSSCLGEAQSHGYCITNGEHSTRPEFCAGDIGVPFDSTDRITLLNGWSGEIVIEANGDVTLNVDLEWAAVPTDDSNSFVGPKHVTVQSHARTCDDRFG